MWKDKELRRVPATTTTKILTFFLRTGSGVVELWHLIIIARTRKKASSFSCQLPYTSVRTRFFSCVFFWVFGICSTKIEFYVCMNNDSRAFKMRKSIKCHGLWKPTIKETLRLLFLVLVRWQEEKKSGIKLKIKPIEKIRL